MELDHVFVFTSSGAPKGDRLVGLGLLEGSGNVHPGQGTANRRFFFQNAYLELLWMTDQEEIQSPLIAPTLLWERSQFPSSGYSPFGICLRATEEDAAHNRHAVLTEIWQYKPPYLPQGMHIDVASNQQYPHEPMLFQLPFSRSAKPKEPRFASQPTAHPLGVEKLTQIILEMPGSSHVSTDFQRLIQAGVVVVRPSERHRLTLVFDGMRAGREADFAPDLPMRFQW